MKGKEIKRKIERWTSVRVELNGQSLKDISFDWSGASAGVIFNRLKKKAEIKLPRLDDDQETYPLTQRR
jgi:hypothetical protein